MNMHRITAVFSYRMHVYLKEYFFWGGIAALSSVL